MKITLSVVLALAGSALAAPAPKAINADKRTPETPGPDVAYNYPVGWAKRDAEAPGPDVAYNYPVGWAKRDAEAPGPDVAYNYPVGWAKRQA